jgi:ComEC/Rec2-related protein
MSIWNSIKYFYKLPANWFLFFLLVITALNSWFWFQTQATIDPKKEEVISTVRIWQPIASKFFVNQYLVLDSNNSQWLLQNKDFLQVGYLYEVKGASKVFVLNNPNCQSSTKNTDSKTDIELQKSFELCQSIQNYQISSGLSGEIKAKEVVLKTETCDILCDFLRFNQQVKTTFRWHFDNYICRQFNSINQFFHSDCKDILAWSYGLVLGQGDLFTPTSKKQLQKLGITHLVVISGFQVGLVFATLDKFGLRIRIGKKARTILSLFGVVFLVFLVGLQSPLLRSGLGVLLGSLFLVLFGRKMVMWRGLILSALVLLWIFPYFLISNSFWLSFAASWGLVVVSSESDELLETVWLKDLVSLMWACVSTFLFTFPLVVNLSGQVSLLAIIPNLILIPAIPFLTFLNIFTAIPIVGELLAILVTFLHNLLYLMVVDMSKFMPTIAVAKFGLVEIGLYWLVLSLVIVFLKRKFSSKRLSS